MSQAAKNEAAFERAVKIGLVGLHHGGASAAQMVAAKKRAAAKKRLGLW